MRRIAFLIALLLGLLAGTANLRPNDLESLLTFALLLGVVAGLGSFAVEMKLDPWFTRVQFYPKESFIKENEVSRAADLSWMFPAGLVMGATAGSLFWYNGGTTLIIWAIPASLLTGIFAGFVFFVGFVVTRGATDTATGHDFRRATPSRM